MWRQQQQQHHHQQQEERYHRDGESTPLLSSMKGGGMIRRRPPSAITKPTHLSYDLDNNSYNHPCNDDDDDDVWKSSSKGSWRKWLSSVWHRHNSHSSSTDDDSYYFYKEEEDYPRGCSCGTLEENGIWMNTLRNDWAGVCMSGMVWVAMLYTAWVGTVVISSGKGCMVQVTFCGLALACHVKTTLTDPGAVPLDALPIPSMEHHHPMCRICRAYKPEDSHHCRICNRCISRMDHHCPWMNNCIGASNMKFFILFLVYTILASFTTLILFTQTLIIHYPYSSSNNNNKDNSHFPQSLWTLTLILSLLSYAALIFTSGMLYNCHRAITTGMGTIDRLIQRSHPKLKQRYRNPIPLTHIFGIGPIITWWLPLDPIFHDTDAILGYTQPTPIPIPNNYNFQHNKHAYTDIHAVFAEV